MDPENQLKNHKLKVGATPLMKVALYGNLEMVKIQVEKGADADIGELTKKYRASVIHFAAANKKHGIEIIKYFASLGCNLNQEDCQGEVALDYAIREEAFTVAKEIYLLMHSPPKNNLLHYCIMRNNLDAAKKVHNRYKKLVNELTSDGGQTIHLAAEYADQQMCEWLIDDLGVDFSSLNVHLKVNVMYYVCFNLEFGDDLVKFFIEKGLNVDDAGDDLSRPIHQAIVEKNVDVINALIDCNADLKYRYNGRNLAFLCMDSNSLPVVKLFYKKQPHMFKETFHGGITIAHWASRRVNLEVFQWLVEEAKVNTAKADEKGQTVLHHAAENEKFGKSLIGYIISKMGIEVNVICKRGWTPLMVALDRKHTNIAEELFKHGALSKKILTQTCEENHLFACVRHNYLEPVRYLHNQDPTLIHQEQKHGISILHVAANFAKSSACIWLIKGKHVNAKGLNQFDKSNALHFAALNLQYGGEVIVYLQDFHRLDVSLKNLFGETPVLLAVKAGNVQAVEQLCNFDADLTVEYNGVNLLHMSIVVDSLEVAKVLHKHNFNLINEKFGADGKNALHVASELGNDRFCKWLDEEGVNVKAKTKKGKSATDLVPWFNLHLLKYLKNIPKLRSNLK
ncbi:putative ankyrin repeat protein RF_0381 [Cloeon dipterum]|uniref:putative ankyrin repeat protein RF_0381 n=1 Tax=Cloeon dipterum TaxID=197152 RepID=UPI0032201FDD